MLTQRVGRVSGCPRYGYSVFSIRPGPDAIFVNAWGDTYIELVLRPDLTPDRVEAAMGEAFALTRAAVDEPARALRYLKLAAERAPEPSAAEVLWARAVKLAQRLGDEEAERRIAERREAGHSD